MKVLTVLGNLDIGGTQRVAQNLSFGASNLGANVGILAYIEGGVREEVLRESGFQMFVPNAQTSSAEMIEAARKWKPDIIHIHRWGYANSVETKILQHLRDSRSKIIETNVFGRFDWTEGGRLIDAHCLLSKWCAFKWNAWGGRLAPRKRSFILPNPVDPNSIKPLDATARHYVRKELNIPPNRFIFGRVGQSNLEKWSPAIFDVFQTVLPDHDIGLLLVGTPPEMNKQIASLPDHVREKIISFPMIASDKRLSDLIGAMDCFLHMSAIGESFGMVLCEALLSGVPIISLSTPLKDNSQLEVVGHEEGGLVALSMDAIPTAMRRIIVDTELRTHVAKTGRKRVADRFGLDVVSRKAMRIYNSLLSGDQTRYEDDEPPNRQWLEEMLTNGIGHSMDTKTLLTFKLLHNPHIYRTYSTAARLWKTDRNKLMLHITT